MTVEAEGNGYRFLDFARNDGIDQRRSMTADDFCLWVAAIRWMAVRRRADGGYHCMAAYNLEISSSRWKMSSLGRSEESRKKSSSWRGTSRFHSPRSSERASGRVALSWS